MRVGRVVRVVTAVLVATAVTDADRARAGLRRRDADHHLDLGSILSGGGSTPTENTPEAGLSGPAGGHLSERDRVLATAKHYAGDGDPDYEPLYRSERADEALNAGSTGGRRRAARAATAGRCLTSARGRTVQSVTSDLTAEIQAYQALLEGHRTDPDNEELYSDMLKAKAAMEVAWLRNLALREAA